MSSDTRTANIQELLQPFHAHYEVRPYYVVCGQSSDEAGWNDQRVQAGFEVNIYGVLERERLPLFGSPEAQTALSYLQSAAREIAKQAGDNCTVDILPRKDSLILDAQEHFRPQGMLQIRISHARGLDQPEGPSEERALKEIQGLLHELGVRAK